MLNPVEELLRELDQLAAVHEFEKFVDRQLANFEELDMLAAAIDGGFLLLEPELPAETVASIAGDLGVTPEEVLHALSEV